MDDVAAQAAGALNSGVRSVFFQVYRDGSTRWSERPTPEQEATVICIVAQRGPGWRGVLTFTERRQ